MTVAMVMEAAGFVGIAVGEDTAAAMVSEAVIMAAAMVGTAVAMVAGMAAVMAVTEELSSGGELGRAAACRANGRRRRHQHSFNSSDNRLKYRRNVRFWGLSFVTNLTP
jgi:hypothetical protein